MAKEGAMPKRASGGKNASAQPLEKLVEAAQAEISRATIEILRREPFFGHILSGMTRHFTQNVPTLAVMLRGASVQLCINPSFYLQSLKTLDQRAAVLKHEVLHVVFKHLFRGSTSGTDRELWNIAADLVVNQFIKPFRLPEGAILLSTFPGIGLIENDTMENYFSILNKLRNEMQSGGGGGDEQNKDDEEGKSDDEVAQSRRALAELLKNGGASDHSGWENGNLATLDGEPVGSGGLPNALRQAISRVIDDRILEAHRRGGGFGREKLDWLERLVADIRANRKPRLDWKRVLRLFAASGYRTRIRTTMMKESRRFEALPGGRRPAGISIRPLQRIAVVIDTSGSIDEETYRAFFDEIKVIYRRGATVVIVECDNQIGRTYRYDGTLPKTITGGGGTSFEPPMQWLRGYSDGRFDACIYFTDGEGQFPETRPPCPLLWVIRNPDFATQLPFGRQVSIS